MGSSLAGRSYVQGKGGSLRAGIPPVHEFMHRILNWISLAISACEQGATGNMHSTRRHDGQSGVESGQHQPAMNVCRDELFPGAMPFFGSAETVNDNTEEEWMEAARRVACVLAVYELPGFEDVLEYLEVNHQRDLRNWRITHEFEVWDPSQDTIYTVRDAFCIIADTDNIPLAARKGASKCGGVRPGKEGYGPPAFSPDWPQWAHPGIDVYDDLMQDVLGQTSHTRPHITRQAGIDRLKKLKPGQCADVIRAYLTAADASQRLWAHLHYRHIPWHREYEDLEGGVYNPSDKVAKYVNDWIWRHFNNRSNFPYKSSKKEEAAACAEG